MMSIANPHVCCAATKDPTCTRTIAGMSRIVLVQGLVSECLRSAPPGNRLAENSYPRPMRAID